MTFGLFEFSEIVNTRSGGKTSFSLLIKYDTDENFPYNGHKLRLTNAGETRGVHTMVFYGRKSVGGATDIVDTAQNEADVNIDAFKGVGHMFTYSWGQTYAIYSEADFGDQVLWVSGLGVALASIGTVNFWNPGGAGLLTLAGVAIGVAAAIKAAHIMASGEWASVHMAGAYLVKTQGGSIRRHGYFPDVNNDPKLATVRLAPSSEGFSTSGSQNENWNIGNAGNPTDVKVGEKISAVVSGSIQAGSKSGTAFGLFDYCLDVKLEFDVSGDPTLKISE